MRKLHLALWLILGLWLAVGWGLVWPTRLELFNFPRWVVVVSLVNLAVWWVAVIFRRWSHSSWSKLLTDLQHFYWGTLRFQHLTQRELLVQLTIWGILAGLLAGRGYQRLGSTISLLAALIIAATTIAIYWLRAWLTSSLSGWRTVRE